MTRLLMLGIVAITAIWWTLTVVSPAAAGEGLHGPPLDEIDSYCK